MNRRDMLKFLLATPLAATMDFEQLLWVPRPMIVVPKTGLLSLSQIVAQEMERMLPNIMQLFEHDNTFYSMIKQGKVIDAPMGKMRVPLIIKPGGMFDGEEY